MRIQVKLPDKEDVGVYVAFVPNRSRVVAVRVCDVEFERARKSGLQRRLWVGRLSADTKDRGEIEVEAIGEAPELLHAPWAVESDDDIAGIEDAVDQSLL